MGNFRPFTSPIKSFTAPLTVVAFTSPTCEVCAELRPSMATLERQYRDVRLVEVENGPGTQSTFRAFNVSNTPYFVAVDRAGVGRGRGIASSLAQREEHVEVALA